jgi:hypothetical protein
MADWLPPCRRWRMRCVIPDPEKTGDTEEQTTAGGTETNPVSLFLWLLSVPLYLSMLLFRTRWFSGSCDSYQIRKKSGVSYGATEQRRGSKISVAPLLRMPILFQDSVLYQIRKKIGFTQRNRATEKGFISVPLLLCVIPNLFPDSVSCAEWNGKKRLAGPGPGPGGLRQTSDSRHLDRSPRSGMHPWRRPGPEVCRKHARGVTCGAIRGHTA